MPKNTFENREAWLAAAANELRPFFLLHGFAVPEKIRFAVAFTSHGRKGVVEGECWHPVASADGHYELIIRADKADPLEVLGVLVHELVHSALPADVKHGRLFREAALKIGLEGPMKHAMPGPVLRDRLNGLLAKLGPLPHARLNFAEFASDGSRPADRPKKQGTRMLKAECPKKECGYTVRVTSKWLEIGNPHCPKHGEMAVDHA